MTNQDKGIEAFRMSFYSKAKFKIPELPQDEPLRRRQIPTSDRTNSIFKCLCEYNDIPPEQGFAWLVSIWADTTIEDIHAANPNAPDDMLYSFG